MDNYVPGKGTIGIGTVKKQALKNVTKLLDDARNLFQDKYGISSQHVLPEAKDPVLVIDGQSILPSIAKVTLEKIAPEGIYDIYVNEFFPVPNSVYGQNAKNGLVQIWTKKKHKE